MKGDKIRYHSQLMAFPWKPVAKTACGITAATMAISYLKPEVTPMEVLIKACELHRVPNDWPCLWLVVEANGKTIEVPMAEKSDSALMIGSEGLLVSDKNPHEGVINYEPTFSINRGYDHRGSERLFRAFGIKASMVGDKNKPVEEAELMEAVGSGAMFVASVTRQLTTQVGQVAEGSTTHVVLITDLIHFDDRDWYYIIDPYSLNNQKIEYLQPVEGFHKVAFNGYGTAIWMSSSTL